jgi:lysophospholipase L1-like esterase
MGIRKVAAAIAAAVILSAGVGAPAVARHDPPPLTIFVVGDSISVGCDTTPLTGWCGELSTLLTQRSIAHTITGIIRPGWSCQAIQAEFEAAFNAKNPDLVIMNCGTNDAPPFAPYEPMGEKWRSMVEYSYVHGALILPVFIQYSNPEINQKAGRGWLVPAEANANDTIYFNRQYYVNAPNFFAGLADLQQVPGDWAYLNGGTDGIHPNAFGNWVYAALFYRALRAQYGWPNTVPKPCGMFGHRSIYDPPAFTPCTGCTS